MHFVLFCFPSFATSHGSIFSITSSYRVVDKLHINLMGFENSQVCLLIQNEMPARANSVSWLLCWNRSIYKLPPFFKYLTTWWQRLLLWKAVLSSMLSVYNITDQNTYFSFCLIILVYYMKLPNVITKLGKMGRAVLASPFFCMWIHLIETAMCLTGFSLGQNNSLLKTCSPLLLDISTATAVSPLSLLTSGMNHQRTLVLEFGQTDCNIL